MNRARIFLRRLLGLILLIAAGTKIADPHRFLIALFSYQLPLPDVLLRLAAVALPWLELLCGAALIANAWIDAARAWLFVMLAAFLISTGQAWARGLDITCGCVNWETLGLRSWSRSLESPPVAFVKNLALLAATVVIGGRPEVYKPDNSVKAARVPESFEVR